MTPARRPAIIGLAFGDPYGTETFSGLSRRLFGAVCDTGCLVATVNTRILRPWDLLTGLINFKSLCTRRGPRLRRRWLWKPSTVRSLSSRVYRRTQKIAGATAILQVGTHIYPIRPGLPHFCITDATLTQAAAARRFYIDHLKQLELADAILVQKRIFDSCRAVFVLSEWARKSVVQDFSQDPEKVVVVGAGVNMDRIPVVPGKYSARNILFVGYEWENKGGPLLLEAFNMVRRVVPDATMAIVGCKPSIRHPGVAILGKLRKDVPAERARLESAFQKATCFCLLSEFDAFPNVLLEAQYASTPVVALDRGSRREALVPEKTGILVREACPRAVADALIRVLAFPQVAAAMGACGSEFVAKRFTWSTVAARLVHHIEASCRESHEK